jgi:hypothetical protein
MCAPTGGLDGRGADGAPPDATAKTQHAVVGVGGDDDDDDDLSIARRVLHRGTLLACASVVLLITGMSITSPHAQGRRDALGCDSLCHGAMASARSALGLFGTAAIGRMSDGSGSRLARSLGSLGTAADGVGPSGRRACLYLGTIATMIGLAMSLSTTSLLGLWLGMIPDALLQHNFDVYKALLSEYHNDIDDAEARARIGRGDDGPSPPGGRRGDGSPSEAPTSRSGSVGKLGMSLGISFMIGPMIAAVASPTFQFATCLAMACTAASGVAIFHLPLPIARARREERDAAGDGGKNSAAEKKENEFTAKNLLRPRTPKSRAAMVLLVIRLNMSLAFHVFNTIWPASLKGRFDFGPSDHARFMSFIGISYAFSQGFLAKRLVRLWGRDGRAYLIMACCAVLGAGRYVAYFTNSLVVMYATFMFVVNALGTMNTVITADTGSIAPGDEIGALFGLLQAAESAAGIVGPFLGGVASKFGGDAPLFAAVGVYGGLFAFVSWGYDAYVVHPDGGDNSKGRGGGGIASSKSEGKKTV